MASSGELQRTFRASSGTIGHELAACQSGILSQTFHWSFWKAVRRSIIRNAFRDRPSRRALLRHLAVDSKRLWQRIRHVPGISILYVSAAQPGRDLEDLFQGMKQLYQIGRASCRERG